MRAMMAVALLIAGLGAGCHLHFWVGSHELTIPPESSPTPTPTSPPKWT